MKRIKSVMPVILAIILGTALLLGACSTETSVTTATTTQTSTTTSQITSTTTQVIQVIELTFASSNSPTHPQSIADIAWMAKMEELTGGRVHFTPYWGGALMKSADAWDELVAGVADVTEFSGAYVKEGFDLEKAQRILFYGVANPDIARKVYDEARAAYPQIDEEFSKAKVLARHVVSPYNLVTTTKAVRTLDDFKGLRLKVTGDFGKIAEKVGALGQTIPMADTYVALEKNTIDGAFTPAETLKSFNFADYVRYITMLNMAVGPTPHRAMNLNSWNKLPADIQQIFEDNIVWYGKEIEKELYAADDAGIALALAKGAEIIDLSEADLAQYYAYVHEVCLANMAVLDGKGLPGTVMYTKIRELIEKYNP